MEESSGCLSGIVFRIRKNAGFGSWAFSGLLPTSPFPPPDSSSSSWTPRVIFQQPGRNGNFILAGAGHRKGNGWAGGMDGRWEAPGAHPQLLDGQLPSRGRSQPGRCRSPASSCLSQDLPETEESPSPQICHLSNAEPKMH